MFYIVGLGNPGTEYKNTRHNLGWWALDALIDTWELPAARPSKRYDGLISEGMVQGEPVTILYPHTYMNNSGLAIQKLVPRPAHDQLIVIYDEVDVPQGVAKISYGNGAGGHNGLASVIERFGTRDFTRIRLGIAPADEATGKALRPHSDDLATYVLARVSDEEKAKYMNVLPQVAEMVETIMLEGKERAMNRFN